MFTHNYAFGAYRKLASELQTAVSKVQSEKLAVLLSDAAASIEKLIVVVEQKEQLLKSRTQAHFGVLKAWAGDIVVAGPSPISTAIAATKTRSTGPRSARAVWLATLFSSTERPPSPPSSGGRSWRIRLRENAAKKRSRSRLTEFRLRT